MIAIATYIDNQPHLIIEFGWLYRSWLYSDSWKASQIVAFYNPNINMQLLPKDDTIIYVPLPPLTEVDKSWNNYPFINSIWYLTTPEAEFLTGFDYVLRTDNDCFLTPNFPNLQPRLATFGIGMYAQRPKVVIRLAEIAEKWGILPNFNNVGSTFMMHGNLALVYSKLQLEYCERLRKEEFKNGPGEWPEWFFGVLSMYAGNLAANAFFGMGLTLGGLDIHCMSNDPICPTDYHIHAWHTYEHFSKFKWRQGEYKNWDLNNLDKNRISDYCLYIAGVGS